MKGIVIFCSLFLITSAIVKADPPTTVYTPGQTLAPTCVPGSTNCTVTTPAISTRTINTTSPISGGGDLSADRTLTVGGLSSLGTANYLVGVNSGATGWEYKNILGTTNQITVTHGAGSITLSAPQDLATTSSPTFVSPVASTAFVPDANGGAALGSDGLGFSGLFLKDTAAAYEVTLQTTNTAISADRVLTLDLGDAARTLTLSGNSTLNDWFDQSVKTTASPSFVALTSTQTTGTAPFTVASTTAVTNLNADLLDGQHAAAFQAADADLTTYAGITPSANIQTFLGSADYATARTNLSLVVGTNVQAYDADLTTYAGITPSANIQTLLGSADYATARTNLGLGTADTPSFSTITSSVATGTAPFTVASTTAVTNLNADLLDGNHAAAFQPADADLTTYAGITPSANIQTLLGSADYATARTNLSLVVGTNVQAYDADLTTYAGITPSANIQTLLGSADYATARTNLGLGTADTPSFSTITSSVATGTAPFTVASTTAVTNLNADLLDGNHAAAFQAADADLTTYAGITPSANIQTLLGSADYATARTNLSLVIGTNVQAYDADLTTYAGITPSANIQTLLGSADYATARTNLGLGTADTPSFSTITSSVATGTAPFTVASTTAVTNLNADLLDGQHAAAFQAADADLTTYAGITPSANIQTFLGSADYATARTNLGVAIGTNVQAYDADLTTYAGITPSANIQTLLGSADYATARTNLGLGTGDSPTFVSPVASTAFVPDANGGAALGSDGLGFSGLLLKDTVAAYEVTLQTTNTAISADRIFTLDMGDAARTLTLSGSPTLNDWFNQSVKTTASPTFTNITDSGLTITRVPYASTAGLLVDSAGLTYNGTSLALTAALIGTGIKPAANSTTAVQVQQADGTNILDIDTTNKYVGINTIAPSGPLEVQALQGDPNFNIVPIMTSNTAPEGVASASADEGALYAAWKAFDHSDVLPANTWIVNYATSPLPQWVQYQFAISKVVATYAITIGNQSPPYAPKSWTFQGSNNGTSFTTLDTQTDITDWAAGSNTRKVFAISNTTSYLYYRLNITAANSATYFVVSELQMYVGATTYSPALLVNPTGQTGINTTITTGQMNIVPNAITIRNLDLKALSGQTADYQAFLNSAGTVVGGVDINNNLYLGTTATLSGSRIHAVGGNISQTGGTYLQQDGATYYGILDFGTTAALTANRTLKVDMNDTNITTAYTNTGGAAGDTRVLTTNLNNADRTVSLSGNLTVSGASTINQDVSTTASPTFVSPVATTAFVPDANGGAALGSDGLGFSGLLLKDTAAAYEVTVQTTNTAISADRIFTLNMGDAARTLTLSGSPTLADWFDQSVKAAATPSFTGATMTSTLAMGANNITMTGSLADTTNRVTKGWFTNVESTNMPTVGGTSLSTTFVDVAGDTMTGNLTVSKADPELRLTDTGNSEYSRLTRADTNNLMALYNRVSVPGISATSYQMVFDGIDDVVVVPDHADLKPTDAITISMWCNIAALGQTQCMASKHTTVSNSGYALFVYSTNTIYFQLGDGVTWGVYTASTAIGSTGWHHIVGVHDGSTTQVYLDGVAGTAGTGGTIGTNTQDLWIGADVNSPAYEVGTLDEVRIYHKAWAQSDVTTDYNSGSGVYGLLPDTNLVAGYHFDEGSGISVADYTGNGHTGTAAGTPAWEAGVKASPLAAAVMSEVAVVRSKDSAVNGEYGIQQFGFGTGRNELYGNPIDFYINATKQATIGTDGLLGISDAGTSYFLKLHSDSTVNLTADHTLTLDVANADRTLTVSGTSTINQDVSTIASPIFVSPVASTAFVPDANGGAALGSNGLGFSGLLLKDTGAAYEITLQTTNTAISADRIFTLDMGDAARTLTLSGNATLNQDVSTAGSPTFGGLTLNGNLAAGNTTVVAGATANAPATGDCASQTNANGLAVFQTATSVTSSHIYYNSTRGKHARITSVATCTDGGALVYQILTLTDSITGNVATDSYTVYNPVTNIGNTTSGFINNLYAVSGSFLSVTSTGGFDLAEEYPTEDATIEAGDVVALKLEPETGKELKAGEIMKSAKAYEQQVLGVVSTSPGITLGNETEGIWKKVALAGRVPVKVSLENGSIKVGDLITSSSTAGVAMKATNPGMVIGTALQSFRENDENDKILIMIKPHWSLGSLDDGGQVNGAEVSLPGGETSIVDQFTAMVSGALAKIGINIKNGVLAVKEFVADKITTKQICVEDVCMNRDEFLRAKEAAIGVQPAQGGGGGSPAPTDTSAPAPTAPATDTIVTPPADTTAPVDSSTTTPTDTTITPPTDTTTPTDTSATTPTTDTSVTPPADTTAPVDSSTTTPTDTTTPPADATTPVDTTTTTAPTTDTTAPADAVPTP